MNRRLPLCALLGALLLSAGGGCHHGHTVVGEGDDLAGTAGRDLAGLPPGTDLASQAMVDAAQQTCTRLPLADDAPRAMVISHPYKEPDGSASSDYELLMIDAAGAISRPGTHFTVGRASDGIISFTPDGELGFVVEEDGSIGEFRLVAGQAPQVLQTAYMRGFYASTLWISPAGDRMYVLDAETPNNGGGIYEIDIHCDGSLGLTVPVASADVPYAMLGIPGSDKLGVFARTIDGATVGDSAHLIDVGPPYAHVAGVPAFATYNSDAIVAGSAVTHDGKYLLFGDDSQFSSAPNRVAVVGVTAAGGLQATQELSPVGDPVSIVASPYDNAALVVSGFANAIYALGYDPTNTTTPFTNKGAITYMGAKPALPYGAVLVHHGAIQGKVFITENLGIRQVRFETNGSVTDLGRYATGTDFNSIVGAIGVQP